MGITSRKSMQVDSIISNPITEEIRLKGHQSIRFTPDGFSVLVSDASYRPVFLSQYGYDTTIPVHLHAGECERVLKEKDLLEFEGESVFIVDSAAVTSIPRQCFSENLARDLLEKAANIEERDQVHSRFVRDRNIFLVFSVPHEIHELQEKFTGPVKVMHTSECLVSLSDQVQASDHQRGVILAEVQQFTLDLLVIKEDGVRLLNRYALKDPSDYIYHTLNTVRQLNLDRESVPVYLSGIIHGEHELFGLLGKYIRNVKSTPYYLESLSRRQVLHYMILSEGSKCA